MNRLFVDNLTVIDFAFLDPERGLVGESWIVDIELGGELNDQGMVFDFGHVKHAIKAEIDRQVDHRLLIPSDFDGLQWLATGTQPRLKWHTREGWHLEHASPAEAIATIPGDRITMDAVSATLGDALRAVLPANVHDIRVGLREEVISGHWYHYTHGLKKHDGNCQRIAHGHRSRLEIHRDGQRAPELEAHWCELWRDIFIAHSEDLVASETHNGTDYNRYRYRSNQGEFELALPLHRLYTMDTDSTVELIACHIQEQTRGICDGASIHVKAFEGVGKGAIACD